MRIYYKLFDNNVQYNILFFIIFLNNLVILSGHDVSILKKVHL